MERGHHARYERVSAKITASNAGRSLRAGCPRSMILASYIQVLYHYANAGK
jgi:hypothetical protein